MAKPTVMETAVRVVNAFRKIGFGGKYATYDVTAWHEGFIELHKNGSVPNVCFKIITATELQDRAQHLIQHVSGNLLETLRKEACIDDEMYVAVRLVQNMQVKLYATTPLNAFMYFDTRTKTVIVNYGTVTIEVCHVEDYNVDINTNDLFAFVDELSHLIDDCKDAKDAVPYTRWGKLHVRLGNGYVIETEVTVKEFNDSWG